MDSLLRKILGIEDDGKRIYRFVSGEVTQEEYEHCQLLGALVFGEGGYVETLGPTWYLVNDPRFSAIENAFIINRRAIFGGDATVGKQYISSDGNFTSSMGDLEQYSELLGEGRYFSILVTHPHSDCPLRNWYLRIFPDMLKNQGINAPTPSKFLPLACTCGEDRGDPYKVKDYSYDETWALIKQECPNYFSADGKPNMVAQRLFDLFQADLLGLISAYSITPVSNVYIELDTGDVFNWNEEAAVTPHVFLEVDILEKALTHRAILRATAAKILRQLNFSKIIREELGSDIRLTDEEKDQLLQLVYGPQEVAGVVFTPESNWYGFLDLVKNSVYKFLKNIKERGSFEERLNQQLARASNYAVQVHHKLATGQTDVIDQYSEPQVDVDLDPHAVIMQSVLKNPLKQELFMMWVNAETRASMENPDETDRMNMHRLNSILSPIFTDPEFLVGEYEFEEYMGNAQSLGYWSSKTTEVEEEYHG